MSRGVDLTGIITGGLGIAGSIFGARQGHRANMQINQANLEYQRQRDIKNESLMRESWGRDDTAVSRRKADLEASGLSPLLAAGSPAAPSSPATMQGQEKKIPEIFNTRAILDAVMQGVGVVKTMADLSNQRKQISLKERDIDIKEKESRAKRELLGQSFRHRKHGMKFKREVQWPFQGKYYDRKVKDWRIADKYGTRSSGPLTEGLHYRLLDKQNDVFWINQVKDFVKMFIPGKSSTVRHTR